MCGLWRGLNPLIWIWSWTGSMIWAWGSVCAGQDLYERFISCLNWTELQTDVGQKPLVVLALHSSSLWVVYGELLFVFFYPLPPWLGNLTNKCFLKSLPAQRFYVEERFMFLLLLPHLDVLFPGNRWKRCPCFIYVSERSSGWSISESRVQRRGAFDVSDAGLNVKHAQVWRLFSGGNRSRCTSESELCVQLQRFSSVNVTLCFIGFQYQRAAVA